MTTNKTEWCGGSGWIEVMGHHSPDAPCPGCPDCPPKRCPTCGSDDPSIRNRVRIALSAFDDCPDPFHCSPEAGEPERCELCEGHGKVSYPGTSRNLLTCPDCHGTGIKPASSPPALPTSTEGKRSQVISAEMLRWYADHAERPELADLNQHEAARVLRDAAKEIDRLNCTAPSDRDEITVTLKRDEAENLAAARKTQMGSYCSGAMKLRAALKVEPAPSDSSEEERN